MKLFEYSVWWRFSSENFEYGLVKAESREKARELLQKAYPENIGISVYDTIESIGDNEIYSIYSN